MTPPIFGRELIEELTITGTNPRLSLELVNSLFQEETTGTRSAERGSRKGFTEPFPWWGLNSPSS
jgi:hypothetical protein